MKHRIGIAFVIVAAGALALSLAGPAAAQEQAPDLFGPNVNFLYISAEEFTCSDVDGSQVCDYHECGYGYWCVESGGSVYANVPLPAGALILGYRVLYEDSDDQVLFGLYLYRKWYSNGNHGSEQLAGFNSSASGTPGITEAWVDVDPDVTVQYRQWFLSHYIYSSYYVQATVPVPGSNFVKFSGLLLSWKRQISPAPATATFDDVPVGSFGFQHVEALAASGITAGCDATHFCPDAPLTRVQMAVFLAKALGLHWDS